MAERIVALWWRLKRAERMQDEALDYLIEADRGDGWVKCRREDGDPSARAELAFGRAVARDFAEGRTLDRLTMYERRIEGSLYRTMKELRQVQRERKAQDAHGPSSSARSEESDGWQRQAEPAELADGVGPHPEAIGKLPLAAATQLGMSDSAKQSQFEEPQDDHRQASLDAATRERASDCVKQSQWRRIRRAKQSQWRRPGPFVVCPQGYQRKRLAASLRTGHGDAKQSQFAADRKLRSRRTPSDAKQSQRRGPVAGGVLRTRPRVAYRYHNVASSC